MEKKPRNLGWTYLVGKFWGRGQSRRLEFWLCEFPKRGAAKDGQSAASFTADSFRYDETVRIDRECDFRGMRRAYD